MPVSLGQVVGLVKEPLRAYWFEVVLPSEFGNAERLKYQLRGIRFPAWFRISTEEFRVEALGKWFLPSDLSIEKEVELEFWESADLAVQEYFRRWRSMVIKEESGVLWRELGDVPSRWMRDVELRFLSVKGERVGGYKFVKCYPVGVEVGDLRYENNDVVTVSVSLVVHRIEKI